MQFREWKSFFILIGMWLEIVRNGSIDNKAGALVQLMVWHQKGNKPSAEPMMIQLYDTIWLWLGTA